jgi:hypothetical protein
MKRGAWYTALVPDIDVYVPILGGSQVTVTFCIPINGTKPPSDLPALEGDR